MSVQKRFVFTINNPEGMLDTSDWSGVVNYAVWQLIEPARGSHENA